MGPPLRYERGAVGVVFLLTGLTFGTLASRMPAIQDRLDLSPAEIGIALTGLMIGAFVALPVAGALVARTGSRRVLAVALPLFLASLGGAAVAPGLVALTGALTAFGLANSAIDVGMNVQGAHVEGRRRHQRGPDWPLPPPRAKAILMPSGAPSPSGRVGCRGFDPGETADARA